MTTGVLPTTAYLPSSSSSRHSRQLSQHEGPPSPYSLALRLVHLARRSTVLQLVLALVGLGSLLRLALLSSTTTRNSTDAGYTTSGGVLDIGDPSSGPKQPPAGQKQPAVRPDGKGSIGIEVGWDLDGVYRVLTSGSSATEGTGLTSLGLAADDTFKLLSPDSPAVYWDTLETFVQTAFAPPLQARLLASVEAYRSDAAVADEGPELGMRDYKHVWQTAKQDREQDDGHWTERNHEWDWSLLDDAEAGAWAKTALAGSAAEGEEAGTSGIWNVWEEMGLSGKGGILRSDMLRYLLMLVEGGVYTDTDTVCLKPISQWGQNPRVLLPDEPRSQGEPKVIIGIEADVGTREDWNDWWPRPLQIVQWTISSTPHHPIFIDVLRRISLSTARASTWLRARSDLAQRLREQGNESEAERVERLDLFEVKGTEGDSEKALGVGVSVMEWTGPGVWTDSVMSYLKAEYSLSWPVFRDLRRPLRVGEVTILPVTGFSPGVGLFGAQATWDAEAMVEHKFRGSWKGGR